MSQAILLLRSGRHMPLAVAALRTTYPGSRVVVVTQPGTDGELDRAAVTVTDRIVYRRGRFAALRFLFSSAMVRVLALRPSRVAVLWNDERGAGLSNVTRTGWLLGRGRVIAITPDGRLRPLRAAHSIQRTLARGSALRGNACAAASRAHRSNRRSGTATT
jgi:hypothetical protein